MAEMNELIPLSKPIINNSIRQKLQKVLTSRQWVQGPYVRMLEEEVKHIANAKYAIVVNSGTAALHTLLSAYNFKKNDEIITSPFTFAATAHAILLAGAKVVFADISENDFNIDPETVEKNITVNTKAIVAVDLYGQPAQYKLLSSIAKKHNILLFGDSAQSIGASHYGKSPVTYTEGTMYSLYATKNIASAEGGVIATNNKKVYDFAIRFRNQGKKPLGQAYEYDLVGYNYRLSDLHAVIAIEQLKMLDRISTKRKRIASLYTTGLQKLSSSLIVPTMVQGNTHAYHQYTIRVRSGGSISRDELQKKLLEKGIQTGIYYPQPLHLSDHLRYLGYKKGDLPIAESLSREVLSLPINYYLTDKEQKYIINTIKDVFATSLLGSRRQ